MGCSLLAHEHHLRLPQKPPPGPADLTQIRQLCENIGMMLLQKKQSGVPLSDSE